MPYFIWLRFHLLTARDCLASESMSPDEYIDSHAQTLPTLLRRLIQYQTVNPPGCDYDAMTQCLVGELQRVGCQVERLSIPASSVPDEKKEEVEAHPRWNVLGRLAGECEETLHFNAHYDVVPAASQGWQHGSPFSGEVEDGWIYGRGTSDMKGSMASLLLALEALQATGTRPRRQVEVSFTADEETDSVLGAQWLVENAGLKADYAVVMEGGQKRNVCCGHNGVIWLQVTVHGKAAHASTPERGVNALSHMARLVLALEDYQKGLGVKTFVTPGGKEMHPTLNIGGVFQVGDGAKINTVPAEANFSLDRRVLVNEDIAEVEAELRAFLAAQAEAIPGCRITITKVTENNSCFTPPDHPFFQAMAEIVTAVRGEDSLFSVSSGFNDMRFFMQDLGIPTLGHGPGGDNPHGTNERASLAELLHSAKIYARLMTRDWERQ